MALFRNIFRSSEYLKASFEFHLGRSPTHESLTRWHANYEETRDFFRDWELIYDWLLKTENEEGTDNNVHRLFVHIDRFSPHLRAAGDPDLGASSSERWKLTLLQVSSLLKLFHMHIFIHLFAFPQGAVYTDYGDLLVRACYVLEGDGFLAHRACPLILNIVDIFRQATANSIFLPNTAAVMRKYFSPRQAPQPSIRTPEQEVAHALLPALKYIEEKLVADSCSVESRFWGILQATELLAPYRISSSYAADKNLSLLGRFPWVSEEERTTLLLEVGEYVRQAAGATDTQDPMSWWCARASSLPHWHALAMKVALIPTSSATAEGVFAVLRGVLDCHQYALGDRAVEVSVLTRYNNRVSVDGQHRGLPM